MDEKTTVSNTNNTEKETIKSNIANIEFRTNDCYVNVYSQSPTEKQEVLVKQAKEMFDHVIKHKKEYKNKSYQ